MVGKWRLRQFSGPRLSLSSVLERARAQQAWLGHAARAQWVQLHPRKVPVD